MLSKVSDGKFHGRTPASCSTSFRCSKPTSLPSEVVTSTADAPRACIPLSIFSTGSFGRNVAERLISEGSAAGGPCVAYSRAFEDAENYFRWLQSYGAHLIHPPKRNSRKRRWSKCLRRWIAGIRQSHK